MRNEIKEFLNRHLDVDESFIVRKLRDGWRLAVRTHDLGGTSYSKGIRVSWQEAQHLVLSPEYRINDLYGQLDEEEPLIHEEHNTLAGLITYLNYRKNTGHPAARVSPEQEESWAALLEEKLGKEKIEVCKITVEGSNPLVLRASNKAEIREQISIFIDNCSDFEVEYTEMPLYKFETLPEHQGW